MTSWYIFDLLLPIYFDRENSRITGVRVQGLCLERSAQSGHAHFLKTISIS